MLILITYDVCTTTSKGRKRLHNVAKECLNYGQRVQNSVFECEVDSAKWCLVKSKLINLIDENEDSLRFYYLGGEKRKRVEHYGQKETYNLKSDTLIIF